MNETMFGKGLADAIEIQRQFNELDRLMMRQIQLSGSEDPFERISQIVAAQQSHSEKVDELLEAYVEQEKTRES